MAEVLKTNVCCLDLTPECLDYLKSLNLNIYEGSLGAVYSINWGTATYGGKRIHPKIDIPVNLHEYHVFIHDMENPHCKNYNPNEHRVGKIENDKSRHFECCYPVNLIDFRPFGTNLLYERFKECYREKRIEILFAGRDNTVNYKSRAIGGYSLIDEGTYSYIKGWHTSVSKGKCGKRVKLEDNELSKSLFQRYLNQVIYYQTFTLPATYEEKKRIIDKNYISLLCNESEECISYLYFNSDDIIKIILPQVEDKAGLLKDLFENILFQLCSDFFPDIEARSWIHSETYLLPEELEIREKIEAKRKELQQEIDKLKEEESAIHEKNLHLKQLLTETGGPLVSSVKEFLEWLGFEDVTDKDETLEEGETREEDLFFDYEGTHVFLEVKGINGTSTDAECAQIDKIVARRMRQLKTTDVHGIYIVNNQKNNEPLKRTIPPFNETQIQDAEGQSRTMLYTAQLFALHSDIEKGYVTKEFARSCFMRPGLADFHTGFIPVGKPYNYYQNDTVICLELNGVKVSVGDTLYYKDSLSRLVGCKIESIQQEKEDIVSASSGKVGIKISLKAPRNREFYIK